MRSYFVIIALSIILVLLSAVHFIVYQGIVLGFLITNTQLLFDLKILAILLTLSFIVSSVMTAFFNSSFTRWLYRLSACWLGFLLYFFIASTIYIIYVLIFQADPVLAAMLFGIAFCIAMYGLIHANIIKIKRHNIVLNNLPTAWHNRKVVFLSDLHLGQVRGKAFVEKICKKIVALQPDIVFIGGDVFDGVKVDAQDVVSPFSNLKIPLGIFFVMGNHEEFRDNTLYSTALEKAGIRVLSDEKNVIEDMQIIGVDYKTTTYDQNFKLVLDTITIDPTLPSILLKHVPVNLEVAHEKGISLQLSGHTHRAQAFPFSLLTPFIFKGYDYGLKKFKNMQIYTSSGVGTWGPPLRVGTDSEIVVLTLKP